MARLQGDEKKQLQVSPKIIAQLIISLLFMSCILNILYLTQLQESENAMEVFSTSYVEARTRVRNPGNTTPVVFPL
jgi:hypothetical protein